MTKLMSAKGETGLEASTPILEIEPHGTGGGIRLNIRAAAAGSSPRLVYTRAEAQKMLGLGHTMVDKLISDGTLASIKVGRRRLIKASSLDQLLNGEAATKDATIKPAA